MKNNMTTEQVSLPSLSFYRTLKQEGTAAFIKNSNSEYQILQYINESIPFSISPNNTVKDQDYITSFTSQFLFYTTSEILKHKKYPLPLKLVTSLFAPLLKSLAHQQKTNKLVWINNNLTSSTFYSKMFNDVFLPEITETLIKNYPEHGIAFRGVCPTLNPELFSKLSKNNFHAISGRKIYIFNPKDASYKKKRPYQMDKKHASKQTKYYWDILNTDSKEELNRVLELYNSLYLEKHSKHNPHYTLAFIKESHQSNILTFEVLKDSSTGEIEAVQAILENENSITTPFIGYNLSRPKKDGLYRLLNYRLMEKAIESNKILNMSSGADAFKQQRGGKPSFEYHMIYTDHLSPSRRKVWKFIKWGTTDIIQKHL